MSMTTLDIERDRRKVERAMKKRARQLGGDDATQPDITKPDRDLYGRPVRIEIDVCVPIADLTKLLNSVRADITNAIMALERPGPASDRRFAAHRQLCQARAKAYVLRQDLRMRGKAQRSQ